MIDLDSGPSVFLGAYIYLTVYLRCNSDNKKGNLPIQLILVFFFFPFTLKSYIDILTFLFVNKLLLDAPCITFTFMCKQALVMINEL